MQMRLGRSRADARPTMARPSGFEMFMYALLFVALADAGMLSWLVLHGIADR
ncbi:MAG TPA: hypothetical protein VFB22_00575 [Candidatus Baltobacteraceae bacterium]|nr:hypothetical protein [Candidatus Baltobacteraceae bacterium]